MTYYNTVNLSGKKLSKAIKRAASQEEMIKVFMKHNKHKSYTPFEIQDAFLKEDIIFIITSVRRALSNLTQNSILIKSKNMVIADYGSPNHKWQYAGKEKDDKK